MTTARPTASSVKESSIKHREYRARIKARAIKLKGGKCEQCGFTDVRALRFHHVKPVRRGRNGLTNKAQTSTTSHLDVICRNAKALRLLCANCSCIASAKDWKANANIKHDVT